MNEQNKTYTLRQYFHKFYLPQRLINTRPATVVQYQLALNRWQEFCKDIGKHSLTIDRIDASLLARFARWRGEFDRVTASTINKDLRHIRAIVLLAFELGALTSRPKFRFLPVELEAPRAFLIEEIQRILKAAKQLVGDVDGIPAAKWWLSFLLAGYDTGARVGALLQVQPGDVDFASASLRLRAGTQKQRRGQTLVLDRQTMDAIRIMIDPDRKLLWPWPHCRNTLYAGFREILRLAGVETWHSSGALFHRIRKSTASYTQAGGLDPQWQLGHSAASVTERYLDPRICRQRCAEVIPRPNLVGAGNPSRESKPAEAQPEPFGVSIIDVG